MELADVRIGQKVKVVASPFSEWKGVECVVVGIYQKKPGESEENITVNDGDDEYDCFTADQFEAL